MKILIFYISPKHQEKDGKPAIKKKRKIVGERRTDPIGELQNNFGEADRAI